MVGDGDDQMRNLEGLSGAILSAAGDVFTLDTPSKGWKPVTCGLAVPLDSAGSLPSLDSKIIGATRVISAADADVVLDVRPVDADGGEISLRPPENGEIAFFLSVWVNDKLAFNSRLKEKDRAKPVRILKGANNVVVEWRSNRGSETAAGGVRVQFNNAATGKPLPDVLFDMEKK